MKQEFTLLFSSLCCSPKQQFLLYALIHAIDRLGLILMVLQTIILFTKRNILLLFFFFTYQEINDRILKPHMSCQGVEYKFLEKKKKKAVQKMCNVRLIWHADGKCSNRWEISLRGNN